MISCSQYLFYLINTFYNMEKSLVEPLSTVSNPELAELVQFFNETLGFCPNSVLTMQRIPTRRSFI